MNKKVKPQVGEIKKL